MINVESGKPKVSFSLDNKPFSDDAWFHTQTLVASLSFIGGLYRDKQHTLVPPFVPELNEFYSRSMHFDYSKVRSESERIGLVIDACDTTTFIYALPVAELVERIFELAGFSASMSAGGLIARQLISATWRRGWSKSFQDSWCSTPSEDTRADSCVHEKERHGTDRKQGSRKSDSVI